MQLFLIHQKQQIWIKIGLHPPTRAGHVIVSRNHQTNPALPMLAKEEILILMYSC